MVDLVQNREQAPWHAHLPKVLLVLGLIAFWEVALNFLRWQLTNSSKLDHHLHCLGCWIWETVLPYILWTLLAVVPVWMSWRWRVDRRPRWLMVERHFLALCAHLIVFQAAYILVFAIVGDSCMVATWTGRLRLGIGDLGGETGIYRSWNSILNYVYLTLAAHVLDFQQEAREKSTHAARAEARLAEAQLQTLKSQIQPHFLFNALANIHSLIAVDDPGAKRMVKLLSDFLRRSLVEASEDRTSLRQELSFVDLYLEIQQIRFSNRLRVVREVAPECLELEVPHLILQPLVENVIKHAIAPSVEPGTIWISATRQEQSLQLDVRDDGQSAGTDSAFRTVESTGLGLANTAERLRQAYGNLASLTFGPLPGRGWSVSVMIPARNLAPA